jgi:hypothetical protein
VLSYIAYDETASEELVNENGEHYIEVSNQEELASKTFKL